jgi:tetratricopeptide (TPR) repeat protein
MFLIRLAISIAIGVILLTAPRAFAGEDEERAATARSLYELGMGRFQLEEYDAAIAYWEEGFRHKPAPELLYNIAQAHRLAHRPDKALSFYQKYLRMSPGAANRAEVERTIAALKSEPAPAPSAATPEMSADSKPSGIVNWTPSQPREARPLTRKPWFWVAVGGGAAVVAAAIVVGVVVGGERHDRAQSLPGVSFALTRF